jgi:hypothetical protein
VSFSNFKFGDTAFQIRSTSRRFARWMNASLSAYRIRRKAPIAFSVVIAGGEEGSLRARKRFHILYQGTQRIIRTKDIGTLARGLFAEIERGLLPERDDAVYLGTPAITMDMKIALVPDFYRSTLDRLGRRPELTGLRLPVERMVAVDDAGRVIPVTPQLETPDDAINRVTEMFGDGAASVPRIDRPVSPDVVVGHVPNSVPEDHMQPLSRGRALYCLTTDLLNMPKVGVERALDALARLVEEAQCYGYYAVTATPEDRTRMLTGLAEVLKR